MPSKNPLDGIEHYDLKRLTSHQTQRLDDIIKKSRAGIRLTAKDVTDLGSIRKTVKTDGQRTTPAPRGDSLDLLSRTLRDMKEAFR